MMHAQVSNHRIDRCCARAAERPSGRRAAINVINSPFIRLLVGGHEQCAARSGERRRSLEVEDEIKLVGCKTEDRPAVRLKKAAA